MRWAATWQNQQNEQAPSEDSDLPGHPPTLIRVFVVCTKKAWVLSYPLSAQRRLCSDWADAQADLSLCCAHSHFVGFVMSRLRYSSCTSPSGVMEPLGFRAAAEYLRTGTAGSNMQIGVLNDIFLWRFHGCCTCSNCKFRILYRLASMKLS